MSTKIALCMCPCWSLETPPLALGLLAGSLKLKNRTAKQFHLNFTTAMNCPEDLQENLWSSTGHISWANKTSFRENILPMFKEHWDEVIRELATFDVVSFTVYFSNMLVVDYFAKEVRRLNPKVHIYYGGPYCWNAPKGGMADPHHGIERRDWINLTCIGEGELVINELIDCYEKNQSYLGVKGIWTANEKGDDIYTGIYPPQKRLDQIPSANWDGVDLKGYARFHYNNQAYLPIQGSRGCTYKCTFCSETRLYRFKRGKLICDEILEHVRKYGIKHFAFVDSLVNGSMPEFKILITELAAEIQKHPELEGIELGGYARTHPEMDDDLLELAAKAGFKSLSIGVESGTPKILELIEKRQTRELVAQLWRACKKSNIRMDSNWITGFPRENTIDWLISLYFIYENKEFISGMAANQTPAGLTPGTPLDKYRDIFWICDTSHVFFDWTSKNFKSTYVNRFLRLKLTHLFFNIWNVYYSGYKTVDNSVVKFRVKDSKSIFNKTRFKEWNKFTEGTFWYQEDILKNDRQYFEIKKLNFDDPYLDFANVSEEEEYNPNERVEETIKVSTRNEIRSWCWLLHQLIGPMEIEVRINENYSEKDIEGVNFSSNFSFSSEADGSYKLVIDNELVVDKTARKLVSFKFKKGLLSGLNFLRKSLSEFFTMNTEKNDSLSKRYRALTNIFKEFYFKGIVSNYDISFRDNFSNRGNFNEARKRAKDTNEVPNYLDAMNLEKYTINLKRTEMTGKH